MRSSRSLDPQWRASTVSLLAGVIGLSLQGGESLADLTINELRTDNPGSDINEYLEIYSDSAAESLDGLTLVVLGDGSGGSGHVERALSLAGLTASPFALIAVTGFAIPGATPDLLVPSGFFENSDNLTILLVSGFTGAVNDDLDPDDDGILDSTPWATIVDGLAVVAKINPPSTAEDEYEYATVLGLPAVGPSSDDSGRPAPPWHAYRSEDGGGSWQVGLVDVFAFEAEDTPGGTNVAADEISLELGTTSFSESGGSTTLTVTVDNEVGADTQIVVSLANSDSSEFSVPDVVIPGGSDSAIVTITANDDSWRDFDQTVRIRTKATGFFPASIDLTVVDDEEGAPSGLRINEVHPSPTNDANRDGTQDSSDDEFIEIVNDSASEVDLGGYTIRDGSALRHTFPAGSILEAHCAIVVFGGGAFTGGRSLEFEGAILQVASSSSLSLDGSGDIASLRNPGGTEVAGSVWGAIGDENGSLTMEPDLDPANSFVGHFLAAGTPSSPGTRTDGSAFCPFAQLALSVEPDSIMENAAAMASVLTISRSGDTSAPLAVQLATDDSEISIPQVVGFAAGEGAISIGIGAVDDSAADGDQLVMITASAPGHLDGVALITVRDDGDANTSTITINEVDYDQPGADQGEFVEIFDGGGGDTTLDGYVIAFYNGLNGAVYNSVSLDGASTDGEGFHTVFTADSRIQNGAPDGLALWAGADAAAFSGTSADSPPAGATLVDSIVYEIGGNPILDALGYSGADLADSASEDVSLSRIPDGGGSWQLAAPTPGVSNGAGTSSAYTSWAAGFPGIGALTDDGDGDGIANLIEYALGRNPTSSDRDGILLGGTSGGQSLLTLTKGSAASSDANLVYTVEASTDLTAWSTADTSIITDSATTLSVAYTGGASRVFLRLRVQLQ